MWTCTGTQWHFVCHIVLLMCAYKLGPGTALPGAEASVLAPEDANRHWAAPDTGVPHPLVLSPGLCGKRGLPGASLGHGAGARCPRGLRGRGEGREAWGSCGEDGALEGRQGLRTREGGRFGGSGRRSRGRGPPASCSGAEAAPTGGGTPAPTKHHSRRLAGSQPRGLCEGPGPVCRRRDLDARPGRSSQPRSFYLRSTDSSSARLEGFRE